MQLVFMNVLCFLLLFSLLNVCPNLHLMHLERTEWPKRIFSPTTAKENFGIELCSFRDPGICQLFLRCHCIGLG